jgi:hypothetical protein
MILREYVSNLKFQGVSAVRIASFWEQKIARDGEMEAEAFYRHLGLNHIERKGFEWEGLALSREPKEHEKIAVKGIAKAQESSKESIGKILLSARDELIADGLKGIKKLKPATYHELTLQVSSESREGLRDRLVKVHRTGRLLVAAEMGKKEAVPQDEFDALDDLTDLTDSRIANDVQSRIIAAATRFRLLGLSGQPLLDAIRNEITAGSVSYIDRAATGVANKVLSIGRMDEMRERADEIDRYEQSELLDANTCGPCAEDDGKTASDPDDLPGAPNPACEGGDYCRGFIVAIAL